MFPINVLKRGKGYFRSIHTTSFAKGTFKDGGQHATLNDMPIPQGSWQEANSRRQTRYMAVLLSGIGSLAGAIAFVAQSGLMTFNYTVPDYPYEDED